MRIESDTTANSCAEKPSWLLNKHMFRIYVLWLNYMHNRHVNKLVLCVCVSGWVGGLSFLIDNFAMAPVYSICGFKKLFGQLHEAFPMCTSVLRVFSFLLEKDIRSRYYSRIMERIIKYADSPP